MSDDSDSFPDKPGMQKIVYYRKKRPPTLKQYLIRRYFGEQAAKTKGIEGNSPVGDETVPDSAIALQRKVKGITADKIAEMHPEWIKDYEREYSKG